MMLKIAQVTPYYIPVEGGVSRYVFYIARELKNLGHVVDIFTSDTDLQGRKLPHKDLIDGLHVYRFAVWFKLGSFASFWPGFIKKLKNYDIVHVHNYRHPHTVLAAFYCKIKGIPCILTTHGAITHKEKRPPFVEFLIKLYDKFISNFVDKLFDRIITINIEDYEYFIKKIKDRRKVFLIVSAGVEEKYITNNEDRDPIILTISRIQPEKHIEDIITIFYLATKNKFKKYKLYIVGPIYDRDYFKYLVKQIKEYGLTDRVIFTGWIPDSTKIRLLKNSEVFILASHYEGSGLVVSEALATGTTVLVRKNVGVVSLLMYCGCRNCVYFFRSNREGAHILKKILNGSYKINNKSREECVKKLTWKALTNQILKVYNSLS